MTTDEAIKTLTAIRDKVGGDAPLKMADGQAVVSFDLGLGYGPSPGTVYVCDVSDVPHEEPRPVDLYDRAVESYLALFSVPGTLADSYLPAFANSSVFTDTGGVILRNAERAFLAECRWSDGEVRLLNALN